MATLQEFLADVRARRGIQVDNLPPDGEFHRFPVSGKKGKPGWGIAKEDNGKLFATVGDWSTGQEDRYLNGQEDTSSLSQDDLGVMNLLAEQARKEREKAHQEAAKASLAIWQAAEPVPEDHPYLINKGIRSHQARFEPATGALLINIVDRNGNHVSIQRIWDKSQKGENEPTKLLFKNGRKKGCFHVIGGKEDRVYIAEGWATAATINELTGRKVYVAIDAGNLLSVAKIVRSFLYPDWKNPKPIVIAADNDHTKKENVGLIKAREAAEEIGADLIYPEGIEGSDFNDMAAEKGLEATRAAIVGAGAGREQTLSMENLLGRFAVSDTYVSNLGQEVFIYPNLIIKQHVVTIISMSGGGKTTFFYYTVSPELSRQGLKVWYIDADSPASDHKRMFEVAEEHGFNFLNPDVNIGTSAKGLIDTLKQIADAHKDLTDNVYIFDTLKKFADLMRKESVKDFYRLCRKLANLGATVILLGHANKYRDKEGNLIFEGVGDIRSDSDELIHLEAVKNQSGGIDVTTIIDQDRGAKVRGRFQPFSFHISRDRQVTFHDLPLTLPNVSITAAPKATDGEILDAIENYLREVREPVKQTPLVNHVCDLTGAATKRVRILLVRNSCLKGQDQAGKRFVYTTGKRHTHLYELPPREPKEQLLFGEGKI